MDRAEARRGEGGEDAGVRGDPVRDARAAAQAGGDQVEGVAPVDLGAGRAAGRTAVVAADEELARREVDGVEVVEDLAYLAGAGVDVVLRAVAVEADRVGAAAEAGELVEDAGQGAVGGQLGEFRDWGRGGGAGEDGFSFWLAGTVRGEGLPGRRMLGGIEAAPGDRQAQRLRWSFSRERRTTAAIATETAAMATAVRSAVRTTPPVSAATTVPVLIETAGTVARRRAGAGSVGAFGAWWWAGGGVGLSGYLGRNTAVLSSSTRLGM
ncbi:hypothetical protein GCM10012286_38360 [Streptomyces lasiicapitis]|uniref:Uncharacterized protein n=1 Tax=Streptomyces lasiicapitis TaxID=1923961 RepID=A0ABQ2M4B0_9ACTN|nr:hypothetical protein GCM10012286_38360 [Streptomyces lasiicapitis]